jgi:hypothetical protein
MVFKSNIYIYIWCERIKNRGRQAVHDVCLDTLEDAARLQDRRVDRCDEGECIQFNLVLGNESKNNFSLVQLWVMQ